MTLTVPFTASLSERWLLERTYHAQLSNGQEISAPHLTLAMQQLSDFENPIPTQSAKSKVPEELPAQASRRFSVPISTWSELTQEEARAAYQQGKPVLLYGEHIWQHIPETSVSWRPNQNMRTLMYGSQVAAPETVAGIEYAVCYLSTGQGIFSNAAWKSWFSSDPDVLFTRQDQPILFLSPETQFPFTTHYTVVASDGKVSEYPDPAGAVRGFENTPAQKMSPGNLQPLDTSHFSYYNEVTCPGGIYRLEFFGAQLNKPGYTFTE